MEACWTLVIFPPHLSNPQILCGILHNLQSFQGWYLLIVWVMFHRLFTLLVHPVADGPPTFLRVLDMEDHQVVNLSVDLLGSDDSCMTAMIGYQVLLLSV